MIEVRNLSKYFGSIKALDNLTLSIPKGRAVGFLGPNGAGKTTTIKILTNLIRATSGNALLNDCDVAIDPKNALGNVGAIVETPEFYTNLTPLETLSYLGSIRGMCRIDIRRRSDEVLSELKLDAWKDTRVGKFSKGMKQRLAIAQALIHEPEILILDEPTNGLDPRGMVEVREIIRMLKKQRRTVFMSSHLLFEVQETCDSAALIDHGKLLVYDSIENLGRLTKVTKIEVTSVNEVSLGIIQKIREMKNAMAVETVNPYTFLVTFEGPMEEQSELLRAIQAMGVEVKSFSPVGLPLEMLYMDLVRESR